MKTLHWVRTIAGKSVYAMGNTTSCCVASSPKHRRNNHSRLEPYRPEPELSREDTGCNLQHISDRENLDGKKGDLRVHLPNNGAVVICGWIKICCAPLENEAGY